MTAEAHPPATLREHLARVLHDANTGRITPDNNDPTLYGRMADAVLASSAFTSMRNQLTYHQEQHAQTLYELDGARAMVGNLNRTLARRGSVDPAEAWKCPACRSICDPSWKRCPYCTSSEGERLAYLIGQYDRLLAAHERVVMDTEQDRELHARAIATFRAAVEPIRSAKRPGEGE